MTELYQPLHDDFAVDRTVLHEGAPEWIRTQLLSQFSALLDLDPRLAEDLQAELQLSLPSSTSRQVALLRMGDENGRRLIDFLNFAIKRVPPTHHPVKPTDSVQVVLRVGELLIRGQSAWMATQVDRRFCLVRRVDATVQEAAEEAMAGPDAAAHHLREAWQACYRHDGDPDRAVDQAIRAMEAALRPVVAASDGQATLGKIAGNLRDGSSKWTLPLAGTKRGVAPLATLAAQIEHAWRTHQRHAASDGTVSGNTSDEAEAVVATAVHVVHLVQRGLLQAAS